MKKKKHPMRKYGTNYLTWKQKYILTEKFLDSFDHNFRTKGEKDLLKQIKLKMNKLK